MGRDQDQHGKGNHEQQHGRDTVQLLKRRAHVLAYIAHQQRKTYEDEKDVSTKDTQRGFAESEKRLDRHDFEKMPA